MPTSSNKVGGQPDASPLAASRARRAGAVNITNVEQPQRQSAKGTPPRPPQQPPIAQHVAAKAKSRPSSARSFASTCSASKQHATKGFGRTFTPPACARRKDSVPVAEMTAHARRSLENLQLELSALQGMCAAVSNWVVELEAQGELHSNRASVPSLDLHTLRRQGSPGRHAAPDAAKSRPSSSRLSNGSSQGHVSVHSSDPAAAEFAEGVRSSSPVGARHRLPMAQSKVDAASHVLEELEVSTQKCRMAVMHTSSLVNRFEDLGEGIAASVSVERRPQSEKHIDKNDLPITQRVAGANAVHGIAMLKQTLKTRLEENRRLCSSCQALGDRAFKHTSAGQQVLVFPSLPSPTPSSLGIDEGPSASLVQHLPDMFFGETQ